MHDNEPISWWQELVQQNQVEDVWDKYLPTQQIYDSFHNQWDFVMPSNILRCNQAYNFVGSRFKSNIQNSPKSLSEC